MRYELRIKQLPALVNSRISLCSNSEHVKKFWIVFPFFLLLFLFIIFLILVVVIFSIDVKGLFKALVISVNLLNYKHIH